ncbi:MAG TPA: alkaline phosphatase family protein [Candidatus Acidoferrales bacterium]
MIRKNLRWMAAMTMAANMAVLAPVNLSAAPKDKGGNSDAAAAYQTTTPIKHVVVIFQENVSFDHYFATYPNALNPEGEVKFKAKANTPTVNGLTDGQIELNQTTGFKPVRLDPSQNYTCDMNHDYTPEQQAFDSGLMDKFPEFTSGGGCNSSFPGVQGLGAGVVMGYYDGNTVTALWNYAQNYAMDDNHYGTNFGPSTPGAINVVSGMTGGVDPATDTQAISDQSVVHTANGDVIIGDDDAFYDNCGATGKFGMLAKNENIGTLLNSQNITWGWFQGGFTPNGTSKGTITCTSTTNRLNGTPETAYSSHHNPFDYYTATANPNHTPPKNLAEIGHNGPANHQYDISWFSKAALAGDLPAVSYIKAPRANDGHPSNSSPLDEQYFLVNLINTLQSSPDWDSTAVIITWDDSDGWFDHQMSPIVNQSLNVNDALTGTGMCGTGSDSLEGIQARCGYGPRIPFLVISPYAKQNFVDHTVIDQSSVVAFIEDNWGLPRIGNGSFDEFAGSIENMFNFKNQRDDVILLDPTTGQVVVDSKN